MQMVIQPSTMIKACRKVDFERFRYDKIINKSQEKHKHSYLYQTNQLKFFV